MSYSANKNGLKISHSNEVVMFRSWKGQFEDMEVCEAIPFLFLSLTDGFGIQACWQIDRQRVRVTGKRDQRHKTDFIHLFNWLLS